MFAYVREREYYNARSPSARPSHGGRRQEPCDVNFRRRLRGDHFLFAAAGWVFLVAFQSDPNRQAR